MASFDRREVTIRRVEYSLDSPTNNGEMRKALTTAITEYRRLNNIGPGYHEYDDWLTIEARDGDVVLWFEVKEANRG